MDNRDLFEEKKKDYLLSFEQYVTNYRYPIVSEGTFLDEDTKRTLINLQKFLLALPQPFRIDHVEFVGGKIDLAFRSLDTRIDAGSYASTELKDILEKNGLPEPASMRYLRQDSSKGYLIKFANLPIEKFKQLGALYETKAEARAEANYKFSNAETVSDIAKSFLTEANKQDPDGKSHWGKVGGRSFGLLPKEIDNVITTLKNLDTMMPFQKFTALISIKQRLDKLADNTDRTPPVREYYAAMKQKLDEQYVPMLLETWNQALKSKIAQDKVVSKTKEKTYIDKEYEDIKAMMQAAAKSSKTSEAQLGQIYFALAQGAKDVEKNASKTAEFIKKAADLGNSDAQNVLATSIRKESKEEAKEEVKKFSVKDFLDTFLYELNTIPRAGSENIKLLKEQVNPKALKNRKLNQLSTEEQKNFFATLKEFIANVDVEKETDPKAKRFFQGFNKYVTWVETPAEEKKAEAIQIVEEKPPSPEKGQQWTSMWTKTAEAKSTNTEKMDERDFFLFLFLASLKPITNKESKTIKDLVEYTKEILGKDAKGRQKPFEDYSSLDANKKEQLFQYYRSTLKSVDVTKEDDQKVKEFITMQQGNAENVDLKRKEGKDDKQDIGKLDESSGLHL